MATSVSLVFGILRLSLGSLKRGVGALFNDTLYTSDAEKIKCFQCYFGSYVMPRNTTAADFDSAIRRFESSRPSQTSSKVETGRGLWKKGRDFGAFA